MDSWSLEAFRKPYLKVGHIEKTGAGIFELGESGSEFVIESQACDELIATVHGLKSPDNAQWRSLSERHEHDEVRALINHLNEAGLVRESSPEHTLQGKRNITQDSLAEALDALHTTHFDDPALCHQLLDFIDNLHNTSVRQVLAESGHVYIKYAKLTLLCWTVTCPPAVMAAKKLLNALTGHGDSESSIEYSAFWAGELRKCLSVLVWLLNRSQKVDTRKVDFPALHIEEVDSGVNLAVRLERWGLDFMEHVAPSQYQQALAKTGPGRDALIAASYAQEYYITDRFVDLISPAIAQRLPRPLKKLARRYYMEEAGHELYELKTCKALGMTEAQLHSSLPTPFGQLVCDLYTCLASKELVAYFAAATITEGLPGQVNLLNELSAANNATPLFNKTSRKHESLNDKLGHQYISRIMLAEVGELSIEEQQTAANAYALLLDLNIRAWEQLHDFHITLQMPAINHRMLDYIA
ncbi:hypothetical protein [Pseudomonas sp. MWU13-2517]|uniref:hypothetical protein n=1 Tax=Pseudomonas sp. MWU13-2517 TaxID=2929055 RepID=UPI00200F3AF8|nr:hypothetical protein [Pseudomonas sp. MWU13-2517]